jgi:hypothetical protein
MIQLWHYYWNSCRMKMKAAWEAKILKISWWQQQQQQEWQVPLVGAAAVAVQVMLLPFRLTWLPESREAARLPLPECAAGSQAAAAAAAAALMCLAWAQPFSLQIAVAAAATLTGQRSLHLGVFCPLMRGLTSWKSGAGGSSGSSSGSSSRLAP